MTTPIRLIDSAANIFSQMGEDGMIAKIFETMGVTNTWCVEFGAWNGTHYSNTCNLITNKGWSGVLIEADPQRFVELRTTYAANPKVIPVKAFVNFSGPDTLDNLLAKTAIPKSFDLLSIDIDGNDYHIWDSLKKFQPRVVVIEFNPTIPADIEFVQPKDMNVTQGSSLAALVTLGTRKGYELVAATFLNAFFVRREDFKRFAITDNSPAALKQTSAETRLFQLYDGTVVLAGRNRLLWHDITLRQRHVQILPRMFRRHPDNMNPVQSFLFKVWRKLHNRYL